MSRWRGRARFAFAAAYAALALAGSLAFWVYFVIFIGNLPRLSSPWVAPSVDVGHAYGTVAAFAINAALIALFGLQHSLMAREGVKNRISRFVGHGLDRATYVHAANAAAWAIVLFWQPIPQVIWSVSGPLAWCLWALFGLGWFILLTGAMSFGLLELHGIPQALAHARGKKYKGPQFKARGWYARIRHPMYVGLVLGIWATPHMTAGHLLLAAGLSVYLLIGMHYEERDLALRFEGYPRR